MDKKKQTKQPIEEVEDIETTKTEPVPSTQDNSVLEAAQAEIAHWKDKYLRALADYENLERRAHGEILKAQVKTKKQVLNRFLDVLDTIHQAEVFINDPGLKMVKDNFLKILRDEHIEEMDLLHKEYDPYTAECLEVVEDPKHKNEVIEVLSNGYTLNGEVIRIARVKVGK